MATLAQNIQRAIDDFNSIENAIVQKGVSVPDGTPTSEYGEKILSIETGVDTSGDTVVPSALRDGYTAHNAAGQEITGTIPNYDGGDTVEMTSPEGATLNTAGTYCEGNIEVVPKLQSKTATTGEIVTADEGYSGLKEVDTNPVFEAGKKSEYDAFWDAAQLNGNRNRYEGFGAGVGTPSEIWKKPKYPFVIGGRPNQFFRDFNTSYGTDSGGSANLYSRPMDLSSWEIDTSQATGATGFFQNASVANLTLDLSNADTLKSAFLSSNRGCANNISIKVSEKCQSFYLAFWYNGFSAYTTDVVRFIEGSVIAASDLNLSFCRQSKESLASVISALSSTTTGLTVTLRLANVNTAFETTAGAADGSTSEEWTALIATKPNWTINLINS